MDDESAYMTHERQADAKIEQNAVCVGLVPKIEFMTVRTPFGPLLTRANSAATMSLCSENRLESAPTKNAFVKADTSPMYDSRNPILAAGNPRTCSPRAR